MMKILQISSMLVLGVLLFNRVHAQAPVLTQLSPLDDAEGVSLQVNLTMTFDMPIQIGTGAVEIRQISDDALVESIDVNSSLVRISPTSDSVIIIDPTNNFNFSNRYYVTVSSGAFKNSAEEIFGGFQNKTRWNFATGCSSAPNVIPPPFVSSSFVVLGWEGIPGVSEYQIWVSGKGTYNVTDGSNQLAVTDLIPGTTYSWNIKSVCRGVGFANFSDLSNTFTFTTSGTNPCAARPTMQATSNRTNNSVRLNWSSKTGVSDYQVWISGIGTFYTTNGLNYINITGLTPGSTYTYSVKAVCKSSGSTIFSSAATGQFSTTGSTPCDLDISGLTATTGETTAVLQWTANPGVTDYQLWVSGIGTISSTGGGNSYPLFGLQPGSTYSWSVKSKCSSTGKTFFSSLSTSEFTTTGQNACANAPEDPLVINVSATSATLTWADMGSNDYQLWISGFGTIYGTDGGNSYTVNGLQPGTTYSWAVKSKCTESGRTTFSPLSYGTQFTTSDEIVVPLAQDFTSYENMAYSAGTESSFDEEKLEASVALNVYPNPSTDVVNVSLSGNDVIESILIRDLNGKLIKELYNINQNSVRLGLSEYGSGMYFIHIVTISNLKFDKKLMIQ